MTTDRIRAGRVLAKFFFYILAIFVALLVCIPFFWMIVTSLKTRGALMSIPVEWFPKEPTLEAFVRLFSIPDFTKSILNSFYLTITCTIMRLLCASMAAFALSKIRFKGQDKIFKLYITALMIPPQITFVPLFIIMARIGLLNNLNAFLVLQLFNAFAVFMLRQRMLGINDAYIEAAVLDGANLWHIYAKIIMPICSGTLAMLAILAFMDIWNDYLLPLVLLSERANFTLPLLLSTLSGQYVNQYNLIMAGSLISIIPILIVFICAQKYFKEGMTVGGVKG